MSREFYLGYFSCFCLTSMYQDMQGKELYLKTVNDYWMNTSPWLWLAILITGWVFYIYLILKRG